MKLGLADGGLPVVITDRGVVDVSEVCSGGRTAQQMMTMIVDEFDLLRPELERLVEHALAQPLADVRLLPPLPRPRKILCCIANYWEHAQREPRPLRMYLKSPEAVIGPDDTVLLPEFTEPWIFMHEAELAIVLRATDGEVTQANWRDAVFGYTCLIDVSARGEGRKTWGNGSWLGKSFDTFCPIGPWLVTADEIVDPNDLKVRLWVDGQLRHDYSTDDMEHRVPELIEFASSRMMLRSGDMIACGTNHEGLGPLQNGDLVDMEIQGIGAFSVRVRDPLGRSWDRGIYMGADSTNPAVAGAVRREREPP